MNGIDDFVEIDNISGLYMGIDKHDGAELVAPYKIRDLVAYAKKQGKKTQELSKEELEMFKID